MRHVTREPSQEPHRVRHVSRVRPRELCRVHHREGRRVSVFVTGNKIYMVGRRITSLMVAQDARNETRGLDRFGPSGGGNTLRPVCGCIIPVLGMGLRLSRLEVLRCSSMF